MDRFRCTADMARRPGERPPDAAALSADAAAAGGEPRPLRPLESLAHRLPTALLVPAIAATLIFLVAVATTQTVIGFAERGQRLLIERLGDVYLDGLSALTLPYVRDADGDGLRAALLRMKTYHEGVRELRIVVRAPDGRVLADVARDETIPRAGSGARPDPERFWVRRDLMDGETRLALLAAEIDAREWREERRRARAMLLGVDIALSLLLALVGWLVMRSVLRPVARLEQALLAAHAGQLAAIQATELPPEGSEFGRLLRAFNGLVAAIEERERLSARLADQERAADLGRLAATIAHEVRNPVAGMLAAVDTARRFGGDPDAVATSLDLVERGLRNIDEVVGATLSIYRPTQDTRDLAAQDFADLRLLAAPAMRRRGIALDWTVAIGASFPAPSGPIRQILLNLLLNAAAAAPRGGHVLLRAMREDGALAIEIADDGPGLPDGIGARFKDGASAEDAAGGLGIDVVARLLRSLDGTIDATSVPGQGTRIRLRIPPVVAP
jgi:signal transduction histidine kinase